MNNEQRTILKICLLLLSYIIVAITIAAIMHKIDIGGWAGVDAERFHEMARIIINGFNPYISNGTLGYLTTESARIECRNRLSDHALLLLHLLSPPLFSCAQTPVHSQVTHITMKEIEQEVLNHIPDPLAKLVWEK